MLLHQFSLSSFIPLLCNSFHSRGAHVAGCAKPTLENPSQMLICSTSMNNNRWVAIKLVFHWLVDIFDESIPGDFIPLASIPQVPEILHICRVEWIKWIRENNLNNEKVSGCDCVKAITEVDVKFMISVGALCSYIQSISQIATSNEQNL